MYNTPFFNKLFQFNSRTMVGYNQRVAYIQRGQTAAEIAQMIEENRFILGERSMTGNLTASEDLSLRFTHSIVDIGVRGNVTYNYSTNSITAQSTSHVFNWNITGDVAFHLPKAWTISADCGYTARYGYNLSNVNEVLLNASVQKTWKIATLTLQVYDILHQKKNIVQVVSDNAITYSKYNTLPTYFMLSCTIQLNKMGDLKAKGQAGRMQEMLEGGFDPSKGMPGPPPGGGGPMGPPPEH